MSQYSVLDFIMLGVRGLDKVLTSILAGIGVIGLVILFSRYRC
jgi:hypothetical protein